MIDKSRKINIIKVMNNSLVNIVIFSCLSILFVQCTTSFDNLSQDLKKADCISGVYTGLLDTSVGLPFNPKDEVTISINHNRDNNDSKIIFLVESKEQKYFCSIYNTVQYTTINLNNNSFNSKLKFTDGFSQGAIGNIGSTLPEVQFIEKEGRCESLSIAVSTNKNNRTLPQSKWMGWNIEKINNIVRSTILSVDSFSDLEEKCSKLGTVESQ